MIDDISLQCRLAVDQCRDDVAVMDFFALLQNHDVAVQNVRADHRIAAHSQRERAVIFCNIGRARVERNVSFDVLLGQCRHAGRNLAVDRHIGDADFLDGRDQRARFAGVTLQKSFSLERGDVLHHRRLTGESKMTLDFARARSESFVALLALDKIENAFLPLRQHELSISVLVRRCKFK